MYLDSSIYRPNFWWVIIAEVSDSKQWKWNVIEKHKAGDGYKNMSKSLNIPWGTVKTTIKKWKEFGTAVNLPRPSSITEWPCKSGERDHQETNDLQASVAEIGDCAHNNCCLGASPVRALWESAKDKATVVKNKSYDILATICKKAWGLKTGGRRLCGLN